MMRLDLRMASSACSYALEGGSNLVVNVDDVAATCWLSASGGTDVLVLNIPNRP